jgi:hypothetical protein
LELLLDVGYLQDLKSRLPTGGSEDVGSVNELVFVKSFSHLVLDFNKPLRDTSILLLQRWSALVGLKTVI